MTSLMCHPPAFPVLDLYRTVRLENSKYIIEWQAFDPLKSSQFTAACPGDLSLAKVGVHAELFSLC